MPGYVAPRAGFFLWLRAGDGEAAALTLWRDAGVKVLPGGYLGRAGADGVNPGHEFIRVALVAEPAEVERGLAAIRAVLGRTHTTERVG
jgi:aspartate/methionine/tyrosine aminotransferase